MPILHSKARTRILLSGAEPLHVMEKCRVVLSQLKDEWVVLRLDTGLAVHVRSQSVVALIDLVHSETQLKAA